MDKLDEIIFYALDKAIKSYRQMAQKNINSQHFDISIDQWLLLTSLQNNPDDTQQQIASDIFKDYASITRMIDILVRKEIIERNANPDDRRRSNLNISPKGLTILSEIKPLIQSNRSTALEGVTDAEIELVKKIMGKIAVNCMRKL